MLGARWRWVDTEGSVEAGMGEMDEEDEMVLGTAVQACTESVVKNPEGNSVVRLCKVCLRSTSHSGLSFGLPCRPEGDIYDVRSPLADIGC